MANTQLAQEVPVALTDIMFALDGPNYEIDLNAKNAAALRKELDK